MKSKIFNATSTSILSLMLASVVVGAHAQEDNRTVEQILVTASKRGAQALQDIPMTIQALSGDVLQRQGIQEFSDYARSISGLSFEDRGPGDKKYVLRGIQSTGAATTGVYFDDIVMTGSNRQDGGGRQPDIKLVDMERLEVLKGPQGTLYGASSMSGTIRMLTNKPDASKVSGAVNGGIGSTRHSGSANYSLDAMLNVPIVEDKLAVRVVGYQSDKKGFIDNPLLGQKDVDNTKVSGGRIALQYQASDNVKLNLMYIHQDTKAGGAPWYQPQFGEFVQQNFNRTPWDESLDAFNAAVDWDVEHGTITLTGSYLDREILFVQPATRKICNLFGRGIDNCNVAVTSPQLELSRAGLDQPQERSILSSELRYASRWGGPVQFIGGLYYQKEESDFRSTVSRLTTEGERIPGDDNAYVNRVVSGDVKQFAAFGELSYSVTDDFVITGGIRAFRFEIDEVGQNLVTMTRPVAQAAVVTASSEEDVTFKLNLAYHVTPDTMLYATYAEGFRSGGNNEPDLVTGTVFPAFTSDSLASYEVGVKSTFFDGMLQLDAAAYYISWKDLQARVSANLGQSSYLSNVGEARIKGIELAAVVTPTRDLTLGGNLTLMKPELSADDPVSLVGRIPGKKGDRIPNTPKFTSNVYADYVFDLVDDWTATAHVDYSYVGKSFTDFRPASPTYRAQGDYSIVNARLTFENNDQYRIAAYVDNVFDEGAVLSWTLDVQRPDMAIPLRPRTIGIDLGYKF